MAKKRAPVKTIYYSDELNEDFAVTNGIKRRKVGDNFNYFRENNFFIRLISSFLYFIIAKPIVYLILKIVYKIKFVNKKAMKKRGKEGCFIYSNHTNYLPDASISSFLHTGRNYIIVGSQVVNIKGITNLVQDLGAIPLGDTIKAKINFLKSINMKLKHNASITIYPEAHIWPYYNKIRNFSSSSFRYPIKKQTPVFASTTCYTKRKHYGRNSLW